jgi:small-conductance mechanosensitive channel
MMGWASRLSWARRLAPLILLAAAIVLPIRCEAATPEQAAANPLRAELDSGFNRMWGNLDTAADRLETIVAALPFAPADLATATDRIFDQAGDPEWTMAKALAIAIIILVLPLVLGRFAVARFRTWGFEGPDAGAVIRRALLDILVLAMTVVIAVPLGRRLLHGSALIDLLAVGLVTAAVQWRIWMLPFRILLRPDEPVLRLVTVDDARARHAYLSAGVCFAFGFLIAKYLPLMVDAGMTVPSAQAASLVVATLIALGALLALQRFFAGAHGWRKATGHACKVMVVVAWGLWTIGLSMLRFSAYNIAFWAMAVVLIAFIIERILSFAIRARADASAVHGKHQFSPVHVARRMLVAVASATVLVMLARSWLVDVLGIFTWEEFRVFDQAMVMVLTVLILGYLAYELLGLWTSRKFGNAMLALPGMHADDSAPAGAPVTSRLSSIMPILRGFFGVLIVATAVLLGLDRLGVNISPLLAGAGIFGLAFSFGSQALVRDIVSGIFFVADDAFRVGEYIQAGSHKGTVERLSIRSVRVRHQNGQFHTIPYGQLGAVTNFSRDYATLKFNLRLARDADVEKARKLAKAVGVELAEMPEYAEEFLAPLKMQGVTDIEPTALLCRFKFTVRPGVQTMIQREAIKRLHRAFSQNGIEFASNAVVVQGHNASAQAVELESAGAAATTLAKPVQDQVA